MKKSLLILLVSLCAGCANQNVWVNPEKSDEDQQKDFRECKYDSQKSSFVPYGNGTSPISAGIQEGFQSVTLLNECMRSKGYYLENKYQNDAKRSHNINSVNEYTQAIKQKNYAKALNIADTLVANNPVNSAAHVYRGTALTALERYNDAITEYNIAIAQNPKNAAAYSSKAVCFVEIGEFDIALELANLSLDINKTNPAYYSNRAYVWNKKGEYDKALEDCNKAIAINSSLNYPYRQKGLALFGKEQYEKSIAEFNKSLAINDTYEKVYLNRGDSYLKLSKLTEATADYKKACELGSKEACGKVK